MLEVEMKFKIAAKTPEPVALAAIGAVPGESLVQVDAYYNHPSRDFSKTDEAIRIRRCGAQSKITYKGPKRGNLAKTRFELELPLATETEAGWADMLERLGFRRVAVVEKRRTPYQIQYNGRQFEIAIDDVIGLGPFVEVETLANQCEQQAAEDAVRDLAEKLGLLDAEPRSYLEMLVALR